MAERMPKMNWSSPAQAESLSSLYKQAMNYYFLDEGLDDKEKNAIKIIHGLGCEGLRQLSSGALSDTDKKDPDKL